MKCRRWVLLVLGVCAVWVTLCWRAASQLSAPPRRPIQGYHSAILAAPASHGLRVSAFTLADGIPVLMCEPQGLPSAKGRRLRTQMEATGQGFSPEGAVIGTAVLLHGRRGRKEDWLPAAERLCAVGLRCLLPDLPAHGDNLRPRATYGRHEAGLPSRVVREAAARFGFDPGRPALIGISMGGAVAMKAAALDSSLWSSVSVVSTFDRLETAVRGQAEARVGHWLGSLWLAGIGPAFECQTTVPLSEIESLSAARTVTVPTLVAHGAMDRVIPMECGRRLFDSVGSSEKLWVEVPDADHGTVLITEFPLYATLAQWALKHLRRSGP